MRQHSAVNSLIFMHVRSRIVCLGPLPLYIIYIIILIFHYSNNLVSINRINLLLLGSFLTCLKIQSKWFAAALRCSGDMKHDPRIVITLYRVPLIFLIRSSTGMHHPFAPGIHVRGPNSFRKIFSGFCVCICAPEEYWQYRSMKNVLQISADTCPVLPTTDTTVSEKYRNSYLIHYLTIQPQVSTISPAHQYFHRRGQY